MLGSRNFGHLVRTRSRSAASRLARARRGCGVARLARAARLGRQTATRRRSVRATTPGARTGDLLQARAPRAPRRRRTPVLRHHRLAPRELGQLPGHLSHAGPVRIVSDLCAQLVGGLGFASSGNIGDKLGVFEPTHGSAPKYAGQYKTNPMAMLLTAKLMLDWLGEKEEASRLEAAVAKTIAEGKVCTYDMGGSNTTLEVAEEVARNL